jgi:flagellar hook-basal body complex protein FliE
MQIINQHNVTGDFVSMKLSHKRHMSDKPQPRQTDIPESFGATFQKALGKVNDTQLAADNQVQKFIKGDPGVEVHDVIIAVKKAEQSLAFTKAIRDKLLRAFTELQTMR